MTALAAAPRHPPHLPTPASSPGPALTGWHPGESALHAKLSFPPSISTRYVAIENQLREQHRIFHTSNLTFIPLTTIDAQGRPWAGIAAGRTGKIGFVVGPSLKTLVFSAKGWVGDPLFESLREVSKSGGLSELGRKDRALTAGLGIEFRTRRRNKFAGRISDVRETGEEGEYAFAIEVNEAVGNCPKYINTRTLDPYPDTSPTITYHDPHMLPDSRLPDPIIDFIKAADTIFIATLYISKPQTASQFPSHAGMNARGGLPGFIRVSPSDGRTIVLPDYSGNRFMSSLGNIEASGVAGFTIVDFVTGDILYLTGKAKNLIGAPAREVLSRHASVTILEPTGYKFVRNALPVRQRAGSKVGRSPYSPKIKYLVEEEAELEAGGSSGHKAVLDSATKLSDDLAVFRFNIPAKPGAAALRIRPGQAIVLDFMDWLGPPTYQHMADTAPGSINDDRIRTWTVSSSHENDEIAWFELTMREMKGGAVTGAMFDILRKQSVGQTGTRFPIAIENPVVVDIVGISGDFFLGQETINALWIAGGIGITPFLAMLDALARRRGASGKIVLALSTREPEIMLDLLGDSLGKIPETVNITLDIFTRSPVRARLDELRGANRHISIHEGRLRPDYWPTVSKDKDVDVLICGPNEFGDVAVEGLREAGIPNDKIQREGFY
ncbi:hypothetical protein BJY01DRAFT_171160 [Aspergillus pseudoustus]|uniref:FAD-binding FR-type domain-containing protein n=1 Tax=Aspergillus pseudoustus TaxID=1810923 RepID=A0ABR4KX35_9EURO